MSCTSKEDQESSMLKGILERVGVDLSSGIWNRTTCATEHIRFVPRNVSFTSSLFTNTDVSHGEEMLAVRTQLDAAVMLDFYKSQMFQKGGGKVLFG